MAKPKKADVVEALEKAGIAFDPEATVDELIELLPKDESKVDEAEEEDKGGKGEAVVLSKTGSYARTYTKAVHGAKYKDLAAEYAGKIGGSVRK